jgi:cytochrome c peroxidase
MTTTMLRAPGLKAIVIGLVLGTGIFMAAKPYAQVAVGQQINPPVFPLVRTAVPDVNAIGLLEGNADWPVITQLGKRQRLQMLGKALFWEMQVGGDGIQACATCHYHAGADHRRVNQVSPGVKVGDPVHDLAGGGTNSLLTRTHFGGAGSPRGLPVSEAALLGVGATPDIAPAGAPGLAAKAPANLDVNDVVSSQGIRKGDHLAVILGNRVDSASLHANDPVGFTHSFTAAAPGIPSTVRRVEPRNAPTVLNAVYNFRNFWDGRADAFFNGVNPLGFRDPNARVKTTNGDVRLNIPFSSLASQAVGPIGSDFEMIFTGRSHRQLGRKLVGAQALRGQLVACGSNGDSLLGDSTDCSVPGTSNRGLSKIVGGAVVPVTYGQLIQEIFAPRFWNGTACYAESGEVVDCATPGAYSLTEWNFSLFFGLAVQAYEATLTTEDTIVDLIVGHKVSGTLVNGRNTFVTNGQPLETCIARLAINNSAAQQAVATNLCTAHYAKFIHPKAETGTESNLVVAANQVAPGTAIGGCATAPNCTVPAARLVPAQRTLLTVSRGLGRFFAGATGCAVCHFNPEFTGATVQAITGFGAGPVGVLPPGQVAREIEAPVVMERMITFNGQPAVYDAGFYNIGVRPTPEDISLGDRIDGVPLAFSKLADALNGGDRTGLDSSKIEEIRSWLDGTDNEGITLRLPTSPTNLAPVPWRMGLACGPGLNNANANNNPAVGCIPSVIPGERLLRNGAFKAQGLRNVKFTGPYLHNGSKMNLRQVMEFYKTAGHFTTLNLANLDAGMRVFNLGVADEAAVVELMETGMTDWRVAYEEGKFDHPEICIPHGHDPATGKTRLVGIRAVGRNGTVTTPLQTFEQQLQQPLTTIRAAGQAAAHEHDLRDACTVPSIVDGAHLSTIEEPPPPL